MEAEGWRGDNIEPVPRVGQAKRGKSGLIPGSHHQSLEQLAVVEVNPEADRLLQGSGELLPRHVLPHLLGEMVQGPGDVSVDVVIMQELEITWFWRRLEQI